MTSESDSSALQRIIDKSQARRLIAAEAERAGLTVKELKRDLVVNNPHDPENGQIYVEYATGYVTWERIVCEYWGPLQGYVIEDDDVGKQVSVAQIVGALTGRSHEGGGSP